MKQRVVHCKELMAVNPSVLLMDEPFGALDAQTRTQLQTDSKLQNMTIDKLKTYFDKH